MIMILSTLIAAKIRTCESLCLYMSVSLSVCLSVCFHLCVCLSVCLCISLSPPLSLLITFVPFPNRGALIRSPVEQNPYINIGATTNKALRLAINTAQFGRTFQDRSHVIRLLPRSEISHEDAETCTIYNLNVRGKRGNIVQVYPSVEYDFIPNRLDITESDCLHIQWTGIIIIYCNRISATRTADNDNYF